MANNEDTAEVAQIAEIRMGQSPPGDTYNEAKEGVPLLNGPTEFGLSHPIPALWTTQPTRVSETGDLLFCVRGSTTGRMNWADQQYCIGRGVAAIRGKNGKLDTKFVYYTLTNELPRLLSRCAGSVFPNLGREDLETFEIWWPRQPIREAIASVLGALDDKIELNRRMNKTLEALAQSLFKSWFVDARQSALPKGWREGKLRDCCLRVENGGTPSRNVAEYWEAKEVPWLTSGEVRQKVVTATENFISRAGLENSSAKLWQKETTVVALYGATAGQVCLLGTELCANQACCALIPKSKWRFYVYLHTSSSIQAFEQQVRGSAQQNLSQQIVADLPTVLPDEQVIAEFDSTIAPIFERLIANLFESRTLAALRDELLPKLLSGEVRVPAGKLREA